MYILYLIIYIYSRITVVLNFIVIFGYKKSPRNIGRWVLISGFGSGASFLAKFKKWNPATLEPAVGLQNVAKLG